MGTPLPYDQKFFKKWSTGMAYVLGFICADGNVVETSRGNHYIALYSADRALLGDMRNVFQSKHKIALRNARSGKVYRIQIGSTEWFVDLGVLGVVPGKTKRMSLPTMSRKYFGHFVRGYFDGDGNVWSGTIHKKRTTTRETLQVAFTSGSDLFLRALHKELKSHGVDGGSLYVSTIRNFTRLAFSQRDALKLYKIMYNVPHKLYLKRKKKVFDQFIKMRA